jgi:hypothetical protein
MRIILLNGFHFILYVPLVNFFEAAKNKILQVIIWRFVIDSKTIYFFEIRL